MELFTQPQWRQLQKNGIASSKRYLDVEGATPDHRPVVKLFTPWAGATWLLTEIDPDDEDRAFGLCDLGLGTPELGYVSLQELRELRGPGGLKVERDLFFDPKDKTLRQYAEAARESGRIIA